MAKDELTLLNLKGAVCMSKLTCKRQMPEINGNVWCQINIEEDADCQRCCKFCNKKCNKECIFSKRNEENL